MNIEYDYSGSLYTEGIMPERGRGVKYELLVYS